MAGLGPAPYSDSDALAAVETQYTTRYLSGRSLIESFDAPGQGSNGVAVDSTDGSIWVLNHDNTAGTTTAYNFSRSGKQLDSFSAGFNNGRDVSINPSDGTLWIVQFNGEAHHFQRDGTFISSFVGPAGDALGIDVGPAGETLWFASDNTDTIYNLDMAGTVLSSFGSPFSTTSGVTADPIDGTLWIGDWFNGELANHQQDGAAITSFSPGTATVDGLSMDPINRTLWIADDDSNQYHHFLVYDAVLLTTIGGATFTRPSSFETVDSTAYDVDGSTALTAVAASGQVTLASGTATVDMGLSATDATFYLALGVDDPGADCKVSGRLFWDDSAGTYKVEIVETETAIGNPTVNYDVLRVR